MKRLTFLLLGALLLSSCLAPKYERDPGEVPQDYRFQSRQGQPQPELDSLADLPWWQMFQDPALQGLINTALTQNYDARLALARVAEARAAVGVSRSFWLPQVGGTALYRRDKISRTSIYPPLPPGIPAVDSLAQFNFDLFWEVDLFGRLWNLTKAAQDEFFASEWGQKAVRATVVAEVARAYFELRTLDRQLEISRFNLASFEKSRRLVLLRHDRGLVSKEEVAQADALVHTAGARIPDLERQIGQKENQLSLLLGNNPQPIVRGKSLPELVVRPRCPRRSALRPAGAAAGYPPVRDRAYGHQLPHRRGPGQFFPPDHSHRSGRHPEHRPGPPVHRALQHLEYRPDLDPSHLHRGL